MSDPSTGPLPQSRMGVLDDGSMFGGGRYQVISFLGEGGKKRVYLAEDVRLGRRVALGVFRPEGMTDEDLVRIEREAHATAMLSKHPNIVPVFDIGDDEGCVYIVSQYMAGGDLVRLLHETDGPLPADRIVEITRQVCDALAFVHAQGIVHRDIKPANILLEPDGTAKLGDFGLAMVENRTRVTIEGAILGTVTYMPPECAIQGGHAADARSDLYSLGVTLYELATGHPPFRGDATQVISQHIQTEPIAPSSDNPALSPALEAAVMRMLAKEPAERPQSAAEVAVALRGA